jgi:hypothetical protein
VKDLEEPSQHKMPQFLAISARNVFLKGVVEWTYDESNYGLKVQCFPNILTVLKKTHPENAGTCCSAASLV